MIDQICGAINCYCSASLWQGNDTPVCVCSEWAICGSWCWAALQTMWQSSGISLSVVHADSIVGWCDTLLGYCYRWMGLMCLTCPLSPPVSICVPQRSSTVEEGRQTHPEPTQPVGLSLGEHTMTKKGPAVIASPCLMWFDDGSSLARRWEPDELSGAKQL